jgi:hypothetical protein
MSRIAYDADFYGWANEQAALLRAGRLAEADLANIAEEIESLGRREKRELVDRLATLLTLLLRRRHQPEHRSGLIRVQRNRLADLVADNPSLRLKTPEAVSRAYAEAVIIAAAETKLGEQAFPPACPWPFDDIINPDFWPE